MGAWPKKASVDKKGGPGELKKITYIRGLGGGMAKKSQRRLKKGAR